MRKMHRHCRNCVVKVKQNEMRFIVQKVRENKVEENSEGKSRRDGSLTAVYLDFGGGRSQCVLLRRAFSLASCPTIQLACTIVGPSGCFSQSYWFTNISTPLGKTQFGTVWYFRLMFGSLSICAWVVFNGPWSS